METLTVIKHPAMTSKFGAHPVDDTKVLAELPLHEYGHVALVSTYGSDDLIVDAAQLSYGKTIAALSGESKYRSKDETRRLIRYLLRHKHTSPFEQAEVTFFLRIPIFIMRQLVRHRTANINEYSARYTELSDDFYIPSPESIAKQSSSNKQGREDGKEPFTPGELAEITNIYVESQENSLRAYKRLLELGVARELARIPTPVGVYTELYWKCDIHNLMHMLRLRLDPHAQREIREMAAAMYMCAESFFPFTFEAFEDYVNGSYTLSALEIKQLGWILRNGNVINWGEKYPGMSDREAKDFKFFLDTLLIR